MYKRLEETQHYSYNYEYICSSKNTRNRVDCMYPPMQPVICGNVNDFSIKHNHEISSIVSRTFSCARVMAEIRHARAGQHQALVRDA